MEEPLFFKSLDDLEFAIQPPVGSFYDLFDDPESLSLDESASIWALDASSFELTNCFASPLAEYIDYSSPKESQRIIPEHYGPGCWLSICSSSGLAWVQQSHGIGTFADIAEELTAAWAKQLRLERNEPTLRSAEPGQKLALEYADAYFKRSVDSLFEVIDPLDFEHQLRAHLDNPHRNEDPVWYALRNTVYASGCRLHNSANYAASFGTIQKEAWGYFSNALSVHSELLLRSPSIGAVRALLAMALFAEGLGSPALGSGLIANAALTAQALGLHKKTTPVETALSCETSNNLWLFWAVYCCEKNISRRIGRSSVIDDDDVSCEIPTTVQPKSALDPIFFRCIIHSCQISSRMCKALSAKILDRQPTKLLEIISEYSKELLSWKNSLPIEMRPADCSKYFDSPLLSRSLGARLLHCSYYDLLMVLNAPFAYPWISNRLRKDLSSDLAGKVDAQVIESSETVIESAKKIIVMTRNFDLNGANTHAFMLHYPMHAFINLFIHILKNPTSSSVRSDMALLDVAAGYFGQLDFLTGSKLSFPFARDITAFGRQTVDNYKGRHITLGVVDFVNN